METNELAKALVSFQKTVPVIPKNKVAKIPMKSGGSYSYNYADLADIWESIREPLAANGLAVTQLLSSDASADYIVTKIWHESGQTDSEKFSIPTNGKTPQEVGSVITYYKRYALSAALGISTEEDDDGAIGNKAPELKEPAVDVLKRAKSKINDMLEEQGYENPVSKKAFIVKVLKKSTIDNLDEADLVADALDNESEPIPNTPSGEGL